MLNTNDGIVKVNYYSVWKFNFLVVFVRIFQYDESLINNWQFYFVSKVKILKHEKLIYRSKK